MEVLIFCFGLFFGYLFRQTTNHFLLAKEYRKGQRMGYQTGCEHAQVFGARVKVVENEKMQLICVMEIQ